MTDSSGPIHGRPLSRRTVLRAGAAGALGVGAAAALSRISPAGAANGPSWTPSYTANVQLAATDGWVSMPAGADPVPGYWPDLLAPDPYNMYVFGFRNVTGMTGTQMIAQRGLAQISAPMLAFDQDSDVKLVVTNLGLSMRPDLVDGHTMHWHGFNNAIPIFDGVPEMSASVPIGKSLTYYYRPHDAGTFMYHCHFEDVEHVQMGMTGMVWVHPRENYTVNAQGKRVQKMRPDGLPDRRLYNGTGTEYDRELVLFLSENQPEGHWRDAHIQVTDWSDYSPGFSLFNGRAFPDTLAPGWDDPMHAPSGDRLQYQPYSSQFDARPNERIALRVASLGYVRHSLTIDGVELKVVGEDATQLKGADGNDNSYSTNTIDLAPGESRDVLFTAPATEGDYLIYDRNYMGLSNSGGPGYGGMIAKLRVRSSTLPQTVPYSIPRFGA